MSFLKKILKWIKHWLWVKPTSKPEPLKAVDVVNHYTVITYKGQRINLRKSEVAAFNALSRKDKRAMAKRFEVMQKKGQIKFQEINGTIVAIRNKDYESRTSSNKSAFN